MNTKVIALWGGPGSGKSTTAARLYAELKQAGVNAELVREYVKSWAWEGRKIQPMDQWYFMGKQIRAEASLFGKVEVVVTDSPWLLQSFYAEKYLKTTLCTEAMLRAIEHSKQVHPFVKVRHYFIKRTKAYNPAGRYETEAQARDIDIESQAFLDRLRINYEIVTSDEIIKRELGK